jgi:hypothetical protein
MVGAVVVDQVRRIGGKQDCPRAVHHPDDVLGLGRVAAQQAVLAEQPQIAGARDRVHRRLGNDVFACQAVALVERRQQAVEVLALEAREIEIEASGVQRMQLRRQQFVVPAGEFREAVIRDAVAGTCSGVRCDNRMTGTWSSPRCCAASSRPWPATISPASLTITGAVQPYSTSEAAILATWSSEWMRAFFAYGFSRAIGHCSICSGRKGSMVNDRC